MSADRVVELVEVEKINVTDGEGNEVIIEETVLEVIEEGREREDAEVTVELLHDPSHERRHFRIAREATLLEVLDEGAKKLGAHLLPSAEKPLDLLRGVYKDHQVGEPLNLELTLGEFLSQEPRTHHFAVELVLAIRVNTRWRVAPEKEMTPKAILALADLPWQEYSLYRCDGVEPLPPDTPVKLHRGEHFEAQRDGKYGAEGCGADRKG
jgi:hypothetical protein